MNLSESLAQYSVNSFASFLAEEGMGMGMGAMGADKPKNGGSKPVAPGDAVSNTSDEGASFQDAFPCIAAGNCGDEDLNRYLANWQANDQGAGLSQILGGWGDASGGVAGTPVAGGAGDVAAALGGGGRRKIGGAGNRG